MPVLNKEIFTFDSEGLPEQTFYVAQFEGTEALNTLFHFEIVLLCAKANIDTEALAGTKAAFTIRRKDGEDAVFKGYISKIRQSGRVNGYSYYTVHLSPLFEKYTHIVKSMVFLDKDLKETIDSVIAQESFLALDYEFRFADRYPKKEFAMQYNEKAYDYILWRLEEQGAYFYFDKDGERIIFTDNTRLHDPSRGIVYYSPSNGMECSVLEETVHTFKLNKTMLPARVVVRNYDWTNPNKIHVGMADVCKSGFGDVYLTNEKASSEEEAKRIAKIRAEQILARRKIYTGTGSVTFLRPGVVFTLAQHFTDSFNRDYIITKIKHEGRQEALLCLVLGIPVSAEQEHLFYRNTFECIESGTKYRSCNTVKRAHIAGSIHAFIDGDKGGEPLLDKYGRYKIWFPFDVSGRSDGKASCWIRRAQEHVGKDCGLALPLVPGTEVLITFLNGDPDQPIINRALPNGETGSISGGGNKNLSGFRTSGGSQVTFDNKHNVLQLANATGSEITFGAGSLDYFTEKTHNKLKTAAVGSSEAAGAIADNMSGYVSRRRAVCSNPMRYVAGLVVAAGKTGQYVYDSLSEKAADPNEPKVDFAAQLTKLIPLIAFPKAPPYNIRLSADKKNASSRLQCFPVKKELAANLAILLLSKAASLATDIVDNKKLDKACDEEKKNNANGADAEGKNAALETIKKNVLRKKIVGQAASFLPELGALIAVGIMAGKLYTKEIGGIMIDAKDKNINLHAKTYIGAHAQGGIYLNTVKAKYDHDGGEGDDIGHWGSPWLTEPSADHNEVLSIFKDILKVGEGEAGLLGQQNVDPNGAVGRQDPVLKFEGLDMQLGANLGISIKEAHENSRAHHSWGSEVKDLVYKGPDDHGNQFPFIASNTYLHYIQCNNLYHDTLRSWVCISPNFYIVQEEGPDRPDRKVSKEEIERYPASIRMQSNISDVSFTAQGVIRVFGPLKRGSVRNNILGERQQLFMTNRMISQGVLAGGGNFFGILIDNKDIILTHHEYTENPNRVKALTAYLGDGIAELSTIDVTYVVSSAFRLSSKKAEVQMARSKISNMKIAGVKLNHRITEVEGGVMSLGNEMKIRINDLSEKFPEPEWKREKPEKDEVKAKNARDDFIARVRQYNAEQADK